MVENRFFHTPLHSAPPLGGPRRNIAIPFGMDKLEWFGYPRLKKTLRICITVYTQYRRVTDGQTSCHGIVRAMHMRRGVITVEPTSSMLSQRGRAMLRVCK